MQAKRRVGSENEFPEMLRIETAAAYLGLTKGGLQVLNAEAFIPAPILVRKSKFYRKRELDDWIDSGMPHRSAWCWQPSQAVNLQTFLDTLKREAAHLTEQIQDARRLLDAGHKHTMVRTTT